MPLILSPCYDGQAHTRGTKQTNSTEDSVPSPDINFHNGHVHQRHDSNGCPHHPTAVMVVDFVHSEQLCSLCGYAVVKQEHIQPTIEVEEDKPRKKRKKSTSSALHKSTSASNHATPSNHATSSNHATPFNQVTPSNQATLSIHHVPSNHVAPSSDATSSNNATLSNNTTPLNNATSSNNTTPSNNATSSNNTTPSNNATSSNYTTSSNYAALSKSNSSMPSNSSVQYTSVDNSTVKIKEELPAHDESEVSLEDNHNISNSGKTETHDVKQEDIPEIMLQIPAAPLASKQEETLVVKKRCPSKALVQGFCRLTQLVNDINAPLSLAEHACKLLRKVYGTGTLRNRPMDLIVSTCLYITCRQVGVPRTFHEIALISNVSKKELGRLYKQILRTLDTPVDMVTTADFMHRFCHLLGLDGRLMEAAQYIAAEAAKLDLVPGRSPVSVAAAAIFVATQASADPRSATDVSTASGVSEATITTVYRLLYPHARELFPPHFAFHKSIESLPAQRPM